MQRAAKARADAAKAKPGKDYEISPLSGDTPAGSRPSRVRRAKPQAQGDKSEFSTQEDFSTLQNATGVSTLSPDYDRTGHGKSSTRPPSKRSSVAIAASESPTTPAGDSSEPTQSAVSGEKRRKRDGDKHHKHDEIPVLPLFEHDLKDGFIVPYKMWNVLPPTGVEGKLLPLPIDASAFCQANEVTTLEIEHRVPLVSELEHGCIIDFLDPNAYDQEGQAGTIGKALLELPGRRKEAPLAGGFLRNTVHMPNDVHTLQEQFYMGHDAAEKRLRRNAPKPATAEEAMARIEETFEELRSAPVHPTKKVVPVHISEIFPDSERFASEFVTVVFDEPPMKDDLEVPAFLVQHMPPGTEGASPNLQEPAANLEAKDVFTAYVSRDKDLKLDKAAESLQNGEELSLKKGTCYVFDNCLANEAQKRNIGGYHDMTQLLLIRPAKHGDQPRAPGPTLYSIQSAPIESMRKHSTFGLGKLKAPEFAKVTMRMPLDEERDRDSEVRRMLAGEASGKQEAEDALLQEALALAKTMDV